MRKDEIIPREYGNRLNRVAAIFTQARLSAIRDINLTRVCHSYRFGRYCLPNLSPVLYWPNTFAVRERDKRMMHHERFEMDFPSTGRTVLGAEELL